VVDGEDGLVLQFSHALYEGFEPDRLYERDPIVLLDHLPFAQFEFLGLDETGDNTVWSASWEDGATLPLAVRLDVDMPEDSQVQWPVLMTGVRVDGMAVAGRNDVREYGDAIRDMIRRSGRDENGGR